jgi:hypothetical protein
MFLAGIFPYMIFCTMSFVNQRARIHLPHVELLLAPEAVEIHTAHKGAESSRE